MKKRRKQKTKADHVPDPLKVSFTFTGPDRVAQAARVIDAGKQQTVRMRAKHWPDYVWTIQAYLGGRWVDVPAAGKRTRFWTRYGIGPYRRSGNAWAKRAGYTPRWE